MNIKELLLNEALSIASRLKMEFVENKFGSSWNYSTKSTYCVESIYNGDGGIVLFFMQLYKITGDQSYLVIARSSIEFLANYCNQHPTDNYSLYSGRMSFPFICLSFYKITTDVVYLKMALRYAEDAKDFINHASYELMNGSAGTLLCYLHLYMASKDSFLLPIIDRYIEVLINNAKLGKFGVFWDRTPKAINGLCGFSHGSSGIGFVFLELGYAFKNEAFYWLAEQAFIYENQFFSHKEKNWEDLRSPYYFARNDYFGFDITKLTKGTYMNAWCHGAAGIGLSRLRAYEILSKHCFFRDSTSAIGAQYRMANYDNATTSFTLCHGLGGNAELLLESYKIFSDHQYLDFAFEIAKGAVHQSHNGGYLSGNPLFKKDNSLFMGEAGIGYFYLRTLDPFNVPSILLPKVDLSGTFDTKTFRNISIEKQELKSRIIKYALGYSPIDHTSAIEDRRSKLQEMENKNIYFKKKEIEAIESKIRTLDSGDKATRLEIFLLKKQKIKAEDDISSYALLLYKEDIHLKNLMKFDERTFRKLNFSMHPDIQIFAFKNPREYDGKINVKAVLLVPTSGGIQEIKVNPSLWLIISHFSKSNSFCNGLRNLCQNNTELEGKVLRQIYELYKGGVLVRSEVAVD